MKRRLTSLILLLCLSFAMSALAETDSEISYAIRNLGIPTQSNTHYQKLLGATPPLTPGQVETLIRTYFPYTPNRSSIQNTQLLALNILKNYRIPVPMQKYLAPSILNPHTSAQAAHVLKSQPSLSTPTLEYLTAHLSLDPQRISDYNLTVDGSFQVSGSASNLSSDIVSRLFSVLEGKTISDSQQQVDIIHSVKLSSKLRSKVGRQILLFSPISPEAQRAQNSLPARLQDYEANFSLSIPSLSDPNIRDAQLRKILQTDFLYAEELDQIADLIGPGSEMDPTTKAKIAVIFEKFDATPLAQRNLAQLIFHPETHTVASSALRRSPQLSIEVDRFISAMLNPSPEFLRQYNRDAPDQLQVLEENSPVRIKKNQMTALEILENKEIKNFDHQIAIIRAMNSSDSELANRATQLSSKMGKLYPILIPKLLPILEEYPKADLWPFFEGRADQLTHFGLKGEKEEEQLLAFIRLTRARDQAAQDILLDLIESEKSFYAQKSFNLLMTMDLTPSSLTRIEKSIRFSLAQKNFYLAQLESNPDRLKNYNLHAPKKMMVQTTPGTPEFNRARETVIGLLNGKAINSTEQQELLLEIAATDSNHASTVLKLIPSFTPISTETAKKVVETVKSSGKTDQDAQDALLKLLYTGDRPQAKSAIDALNAMEPTDKTREELQKISQFNTEHAHWAGGFQARKTLGMVANTFQRLGDEKPGECVRKNLETITPPDTE